MITIPGESKKFSQVNTSDLFGNIWYTVNINFDEPGYLKLSNRSVLIKSNETDGSFGITPSFGRTSAGQFFLPTAGNPYVATLGDTSISVVPDTTPAHPSSLGFTTSGRWWNNKWYVTNQTQLYFRPVANTGWSTVTSPANLNPLGNWDASANTPTLQSGIGTAGDYYVVNVAGNTVLDAVNVWNVGDWVYFNGTAWVKANPTSIFNSGNIHALEVFRNRNTLCVSDGNTVLQFDDSYVHQDETDLIIPSDFEICGMAYNGNRMGIITRLNPAVSGKNIDAYFFVWDGGSPEANSGYPIGSDTAVAVVPYKSSWIIITRRGQILYFNGGGFDVLATFPFYYKEELWGDFINRLAYGDAIQVNGDLIYFNVASDLNPFGIPVQNFNASFSAGIWCYDPNIGLYHRYSPSISPATVARVLSTGVDISASELTVANGVTVPDTGNPARYVNDQNNAIGGLDLYATYYIIKISSTVFQLALTRADALVGNFIDLTSIGAASHFFLFVDVLDYGTARSSRVGGVGLQGVSSQVYKNVIYSGYYPNTANTVEQVCLCMDAPYLPSRGLFVTSKAVSEQVQDQYSKLYFSFSGLDGDDKIIVKFKAEDIEGLPISTNGQGCTWTDDKTFTTDEDLSAVLAFFSLGDGNSMDCWVIAGAGAGQISKITNIEFSGTTYTVTLEEELEGITALSVCDVYIENWQFMGSVDADTEEGYIELPVEKPSKNILFKVEIRGVPHRVRIENLKIINETQREAK